MNHIAALKFGESVSPSIWYIKAGTLLRSVLASFIRYLDDAGDIL